MSEQETREQASERLTLVQSLALLSKVYPHWAGLYGGCVDVIERQQVALAAKDTALDELQAEMDRKVQMLMRDRGIERVKVERAEAALAEAQRARDEAMKQLATCRSLGIKQILRLKTAEAALAAHRHQVQALRALLDNQRGVAHEARERAVEGNSGSRESHGRLERERREALARDLERVVVATGPMLEQQAQCKYDEAVISDVVAELRRTCEWKGDGDGVGFNTACGHNLYFDGDGGQGRPTDDGGSFCVRSVVLLEDAQAALAAQRQQVRTLRKKLQQRIDSQWADLEEVEQAREVLAWMDLLGLTADAPPQEGQ